MLDIVREIASRLMTSEQVEAILESDEQERGNNQAIPWRAHGVAKGYAGLALFFGYMDHCFPNERWDVRAHECLQLAVRDAEQLPHLSIGLFGGLSGLAFVGAYLSQSGNRYRKLLAAIDTQLVQLSIPRTAQLLAKEGGVPFGDFDLISGLTGVGAYLLYQRNEANLPYLHNILQALAALSNTFNGLLRWHTPAHLTTGDTMQRLYPDGHLNCGLAHGISGPLALLALAHQLGVSVEGSVAAIERMASWLITNRVDDSWGLNWPPVVPLPRSGNSSISESVPMRPSHAGWCYGSPGIARALWLAGLALKRQDYCDIAVAAMEDVHRRPSEQRGIPSPTFCHGVAGLLQITLQFARDTGIPSFSTAAIALVEQLLASYVPDSRLGYGSIEANGRVSYHPGLLDGAPGVALVLASAATGNSSDWDRLFLLS